MNAILRFYSNRLLFLGSDQISEICLNGIIQKCENFEIELITTSENSPPGILAKTKGIKTYVEARGKMQDWKIMAPESEIWKTKFDYLISASFGYLIPRNLIEFCDKSLNFHPSLLPKYRGSSPIQYALYNEDRETGITVITVDPDKFDKGLVLKQEKFLGKLDDETYASLSVKLALIGSQAIPDVIANYDNYYKSAKVQDSEGVSNAFKLPASSAKLGFDNSVDIYNRFRSIYGTSLTPHYVFENDRVNVMGMRKPNSDEISYLTQNYPVAVPGSLWLIYPGIGKKESQKFFKSIDRVVYMKTSDSWLALTDFHKANLIKSKRFTDFIENYFDIDSYTSKQDFRDDTGNHLKFE